MRRAVFSTIGTSLLTNPINQANPDEKDWYDRLRDAANLTEGETPSDVLSIIKTLESRAKDKLLQSRVDVIRRASAELNGIYGLYQEQLHHGNQDIHWLIATDTAQGKATAAIVETFLKSQALTSVNTYVPPGLSTASTNTFSDGIDNLIAWMQETIPEFKARGYKICFNLVGSFKSLQGYLNTIGMFYADEIIYIFEGHNSELITIPRLPIKVDTELIAPYKMQLALMDAGATMNAADVRGIPESLVYQLEGEVTLSNWGKLVWGESKGEMLSQELLPFPRLQYQPTFVEDYQQISNQRERVKLQETLAKVSRYLIESNGDTTPLIGGGLQYERYKNTAKIDHFRVDLSQRVSCQAVGGNLILRYYGNHAHVEGKEVRK